MRASILFPLRCIPALVVGALLAVVGSVSAQNEMRGLDRLDFRQIVREAKEKVFPTVVFIRVLRENLEGGKKVSQEVSGSGVVISADGEVLSNWHVVDKAVEVRCLLQDGTACAAEIIGADKDVDISLLKLKLPKDHAPLPFAKLGKSVELTEGDFVMAMGAPWGMSRSVSIGIISCTKRFLPGTSEYSYWLQTDASISPGNSGGPLVNTAGEVIGINTRGIMQGGDTGFSIPIEVVKQVADRIRQKGRVDWSWTGLQLQPLKDFNRNIYFDASNGVMIADTDAGSPARHAGILAGDRLVSINGNQVTAMTDEDLPLVRRELAFLPKTTPSTLELVRKGEPLTLQLTAKEKGQVEGEELDCPRWDFTVKAINQFDNPDLHFVRPEGVFIFGVKFPGNAANVLQQRDILVKIGSKEVTTLDDVREAHKEALDTLGTKDRVLVSVLRNGQLRQVVLDYARNYEKE
jgi:serine protease Do